MPSPILVIKDLHVSVDGNEILRGVDLEVPKGEVHALMGPNGSGKSTLASVLLGHPAYEITSGTITFKDQDVTALVPEDRAKLGMFLAFQYPVEVPGVSVSNFLRTAMGSVRQWTGPEVAGAAGHDDRSRTSSPAREQWHRRIDPRSARVASCPQ